MKKQTRAVSKIITAGILIGLSVTNLSAFLDSNLFRTHDVDFRTFEWKKNNNFRLGVFNEYGSTSECRNWDENKVGIMDIYGTHQSSVAMLLGAPKNSTVYNLALKHIPGLAPLTEDDYRGRFKLDGSYKEYAAILFGKYKLPIKSLPGVFSLDLYLPIRHMEFYDVSWTDQTRDVLSEDLLFKADITTSIASNVQTLGNLNINEAGWSKTGLGDTMLMLNWYKDYMQYDKEYLKKVRVNLQIGLSIPTASQKDEDQSLAKSLGNDGAWGIPLKTALHLNFVKNIVGGLEFDFFGFLPNTKVRRLKTHLQQTDFLLLNKANTTKNFGPQWRFHLFLQAKKLLPGLSAMAAYQFIKHDEDRLSPKSNDYNYDTINSAEGLKERHHHHALFTLAYSPLQHKKTRVTPQISLFYKLPVTGKRTMLAHTFGGQIGVTF
jgi:hypothetical protein